MKIFGKEFNLRNTAPKKSDEPLPDAARLERIIKYKQELTRTRQSIETWRNAVLEAESEKFPQRVDLLRLFKDTRQDAIVISKTKERKDAVLASRFVVKKKGKDSNGKLKWIIDEEKTEFINAKWFRDFISHSMDSIFYGHSLIQFLGYNAKLGEFEGVELFPREYTKPEFGIVVENIYDVTGVDYNQELFKPWVIPVGEKRDLGLLMACAPLVIWKKGALQAWSIFTESFGVPTRILQTDKTDPKTRAEFEDMLINLNESAWGIIGKDDILKLEEIKNRDSFSVFQKLIDTIDKQLALILVGQTSTSNETSFVGSAEVQERSFKQMNMVDDYFIDDILRNKLIPLLNLHGFNFNNVKIVAESDDAFTLQQKAKFDIELLHTGLYELPVEYINETYGSPVTLRTISETGDKTQRDSITTQQTSGAEEREQQSRERERGI